MKKTFLDQTKETLADKPYLGLPLGIMATSELLREKFSDPLMQLSCTGLGGFYIYHILKTLTRADENAIVQTRGKHKILNWMVDNYNFTALGASSVIGCLWSGIDDSLSAFFQGAGYSSLAFSVAGNLLKESINTKRENSLSIRKDIIPLGLALGYCISQLEYEINKGVELTEYVALHQNKTDISSSLTPVLTMASSVALLKSTGIYIGANFFCSLIPNITKRGYYFLKDKFSSLENKVRIKEKLTIESYGTQRIYDLLDLTKLYAEEEKKRETYISILGNIEQRHEENDSSDFWLRRPRKIISSLGKNDLEGKLKKAIIDLNEKKPRAIPRFRELAKENEFYEYLLAKALLIMKDEEGYQIREKIVRERIDDQDIVTLSETTNKVILFQGGFLGGGVVGKIGEKDKLEKEMQRNERFREYLARRKDLEVPHSIGIFPFKDKWIYIMDLCLGREFYSMDFIKLLDMLLILELKEGIKYEQKDYLEKIYSRISLLDKEAADLFVAGLRDKIVYLNEIPHVLDLDAHVDNFLEDKFRVLKVDNEERGYTPCTNETANLINKHQLNITKLKRLLKYQARRLNCSYEALEKAIPISLTVRTLDSFLHENRRKDHELNLLRINNIQEITDDKKINKGLIRLINSCQ
ncbi:hypothetical protein J4436_00965 [Candidatus Woesearchaeota archaeon]|nr:hypothetical protein [Candidatus Woesearchaeota archaeon]